MGWRRCGPIEGRDAGDLVGGGALGLFVCCLRDLGFLRPVFLIFGWGGKTLGLFELGMGCDVVLVVIDVIDVGSG